MDYLNNFRTFLLTNKNNHSKVTVKNYLADVKKFINWFEQRFHREFIPRLITPSLIEEYKKDLLTQTTYGTILSARSLKRYLSSLKLFYTYLEQTNQVPLNPFVQPDLINQDMWHLKSFSNYLLLSKASKPTIKNYLADLRQFIEWVNTVTDNATNLSTDKNPLSKLDIALIEEYKKRLLYDAQLEATSVNRKLSSLRKFLSWALAEGYINKEITFQQTPIASSESKEETASKSVTLLLDDLTHISTNTSADSVITPPLSYSKFPPFRLFQKMVQAGNWILDLLILSPVVKLIASTRYHFWKLSGAEVFAPVEKVASTLGVATQATTLTTNTRTTPSAVDRFVNQPNHNQLDNIRNVSKSFYAPHLLSIKNYSWHQKLWHHLRHTRPEWYKKYHRYAFVHYLHFGIVLIYATVLGFTIYQAWFDGPRFNKAAIASLPSSPPRMLAFKGVLTDEKSTPITAEKTLRFGLYNSPVSTGSALVWQETQNVTPDYQGNFQVFLGKNQALYQNLLTENSKLFLGISIESGAELTPRQQIATVTYSQDAGKLQGLSPITEPESGTANVILALDSGGDLTIGGAASPRFEATGGEFTLSGKTLTLTTVETSNANIQLRPDGSGIIDLQKPLQNTTNYNNIAGMIGAVQFDDNVAINATQSGQTALLINQNSTGNLISASGSGTAKFTVDYLGAGMFAGDLAINGNNLTTTSPTFNLLTKNVINLNIGQSASAINIGTTSGTTTINNSLKVNGVTNLQAAVNTAGLLTAHGGITLPQNKNFTLAGFSQGAIPFLNNDKVLTQDLNNFFWAQDSKRLGLGTNDPLFRLDLKDEQAGAVAQIFNANTSATAQGLQIKLGNASPTTTNTFVNFLNGNGASTGKITGAASGTNVIYNTAGADYAEYYRKANADEHFEQGDVVCITTNNAVSKCDKANQSLLGVVSTTAGFIGAGHHDTDPTYVLVGIVGQLPVKLASESSKITAGDALALGTNGVIKATQPGTILGRALETSSSDSTIQVALQIGWYNPTLALSEAGDIDEQPKIASQPDWLTDILQTIAIGFVEAQHISTHSLTVTTENISIGGQSLQAYIADIVRQTKLISPVAQIAHVQTNLISPLSEEANIAVRLDKSQISLINPQATNSAPVASIDNEGNASFSGTLRARRIIADEIQGLNIQTGTSSAQYITNITNVYNTIATPSAETPATSSSQVTQLASSPLPSLTSGFAKFDQGLLALGASSLTDVAITGTLRVGDTLRVAENSINTIGADLQIQPLRQGNISFMGDLVKIDTEGNLEVAGNANFAKDVTVNGSLATNLISPLPNHDLVIKLPRDQQTGKQSVFQVQTATGSSVLTINQLGDIIASGTGAFKNVAAHAFTIIRGAQADTSFTRTVSDASAGVAIISANERERTIVSPFVKEDSLIYITATSDTQGVTPYIARQTSNSFTVQISQSVTKDIKFNWWIVN